MNTALTVSLAKALVRTEGDVESWLVLRELILDMTDFNKRLIVGLIFEDDFIHWTFLKLNQLIASSTTTFYEEISAVLSFLITGTDKSQYFSEKLIANRDLFKVIERLIENEKSFDSILKSCIFVINNVTLHCGSTYFQSTNIKRFLIQHAKDDEKTACIITLVRFFTEAEIEKFDEEIISIIPGLMEQLQMSCETFDACYKGCELNETLRNISDITKCAKARDMLNQNVTLIFKLKLIMTNSQFRSYQDSTRAVLQSVYTSDQVDQFKAEINVTSHEILADIFKPF